VVAIARPPPGSGGSGGHDANRVKVGALRGIEAIVQAMGAHRENAGVQETACGALINLNKTKIKQAGGKEKVKRAVAAPNATPKTKELGQRLLDFYL